MAVVGYRVHGLDFLSEVALHPHSAFDVDPSSAIRVMIGKSRPISPDVPTDAVLITRSGDQVLNYLAADDRGWRFCYPAFMEFAISADLRHIDAMLEPDTSDEYLSMMLGGAVSAVIAALQGDLVLHASAVDQPDGLIAFAGPSGQGKSTLAGLVAADGVSVFADDVLRLDRGDPVIGYRGVAEARLRPSSFSLRERLSGRGDVRETVDGRLAVTLVPSLRERAPLRVLVLPRPDRHARALSVELLDPMASFLALHECLRLKGWNDPRYLERDFQDLADLSVRVPVVEARIPWGPPFSSDAGGQLLQAISDAVARENRPPATDSEFC